MADIRINDLPEEPTPAASAAVAIDGATTRKTTIENLVAAGRPLASQAEAEAGTNPAKAMTPLTTAQAIAALGASAAQGALANTALQPGDAATPAQGALADTALQPGDALATTVYDPQGKAGDPFPYDTKALAEAATISANIHAIRLNGYSTVGDGIGGVYVDADNGSSDTITSADARTWYRVRDIDPRRITRPKKIKLLMCADLQPQTVDQVTLMNTALQNMGITHPDIDKAFVYGDLVDTASEGNTGLAPLWGYPEFFAAFLLFLKLRPYDIACLPGNHDRDGAGAGTFAGAWSLRTYENMVSPCYYHLKMGNFLFSMTGDAGGQNSGEVRPGTLEHLRRTWIDHPNFNIVGAMHQPADGVYKGYVYPTNNSAVQAAGSQWTNLFSEIEAGADNLILVPYGHVGSTTEDVTMVTDAWGTKHVNFQMGLPTQFGTSVPLVYGVAELEQGASSFTIKKYNARSSGPTSYMGEEYDVIVPTKFAIDLGSGDWEFDGRVQASAVNPFVKGHTYNQESLARYVTETSPGVFGVAPGTIAVMETWQVDDDNNGVPSTFGIAHDFRLPGSVGAVVDGSTNVITPGSKLAARQLYQLMSTTQTDTATSWQLFLRNQVDATDDPDGFLSVLEARPRSSAVGGLQVKAPNAAVRLSADGSFTNWSSGNTNSKTIVNANGTVYAARSAGPGVTIQRLTDDGWLLELWRDATRIGGIQGVNGNARFYLSATVFIGANAGSPEGSVTGAVGSVVFDITNGVQYNKKTGTGNTGWKLVTQAA